MIAEIASEAVVWGLGTLMGALMLCMLLWFYFTARLFHLLRTNHPQVYNQIRKPSLFRTDKQKALRATLEFLFTRRFRALDDPELTRLGNILRKLLFIYVALLVAGLALMPVFLSNLHRFGR